MKKPVLVITTVMFTLAAVFIIMAIIRATEEPEVQVQSSAPIMENPIVSEHTSTPVATATPTLEAETTPEPEPTETPGSTFGQVKAIPVPTETPVEPPEGVDVIPGTHIPSPIGEFYIDAKFLDFDDVNWDIDYDIQQDDEEGVVNYVNLRDEQKLLLNSPHYYDLQYVVDIVESAGIPEWTVLAVCDIYNIELNPAEQYFEVFPYIAEPTVFRVTCPELGDSTVIEFVPHQGGFVVAWRYMGEIE